MTPGASVKSFNSNEKSWKMASQTSNVSALSKPASKKLSRRAEEATKTLFKLQQENVNIINALVTFGRENSEHAQLISEILSKPLNV